MISLLAIVDLLVRTTAKDSTVMNSLSDALSPAKSETNSFHNAGSRRAWMRLPV